MTHARLQGVNALFFTIMDAVVAVAWLAIGYAFLFYPRQIARYYADYGREHTRGPIRRISRPLARYIESPVNIWSLRLSGFIWIAMGAFVVYFLWFT